MMKPVHLKRGAQIAAAVASVLAASGCASKTSSPSDVAASKASLKCVGGNSCMGMSECGGGPGGNQCDGMNSCKGMGWNYAKTAADCTANSGHVVGVGDVECSGANLCSGESQCSGGASGNMCKGMNKCAGKGWDYTLSEDSCTKAGGTVKS